MSVPASRGLSSQPHPLERASWFSQLHFTWLSGYIDKMRTTLFEQDMHAELPTADGAEHNARLLNLNPKNYDGLWRQLKKTFGPRLYLLYCTTILRSLLFGATSYLVYVISEEIQVQAEAHGKIVDHETPTIMLGALVLLTILEVYVAELADFERIRQSMRVQGGLAVSLMQKVLRISILNPSAHDEGTLTNNLQTDIDRVANSLNAINDLVSNFSGLVVTAAVGVYLFSPIFLLIYLTIGIAGLPMSWIADKWTEVGKDWMDAKDVRISAWKQLFGVIRFIKSKAWENNAYQKIELIRRKEIKLQFLSFCCFSGWIFIMIAAPAIGTVAFLKVYFFHHVLEIAKIGVSLRLILRIGMMVFDIPASFNFINELRISLGRLEELFSESEVASVSKLNDQNETAEELDTESPLINLESMTFWWRKKPDKIDETETEKTETTPPKSCASIPQRLSDPLPPSMPGASSFLTEPLVTVDDHQQIVTSSTDEEKAFTLHISELTIRTGISTAIIGKTGAGKSSLLYALLGELRTGSRKPNKWQGKRIGLVAQRPWILNSTLRKNILLDKPEDHERLMWAIKYSALEADLQTFGRGLDQETGENGDALSGGQKVRLSLAQVLYQDPDVYLFDDILSALDADVGEYLMKETIRGQLAKKTIIFATHSIKYLDKFDEIYVLDEGKIISSGSHSEIQGCLIYSVLLEISKAQNKTEISELPVLPGQPAQSFQNPNANNNFTAEEKSSLTKPGVTEETDPKDHLLNELAVPEDRERGHISWQTYLVFLRLFGGGFGLVSIMLLYLLDHSLLFYSYILLTRWSEHFSTWDMNSTLWEFLALNMASAFLEGFAALVLAAFSYYLSRGIHSKMVYAVLHSQIDGFLGRIPSGRILNRFSKDIENIDDSLYWGFECYFYKLSRMIIQVILFGFYLGKEILVCILVMSIVCLWYQRQFMAARREILRLDAITRTPMVSSLLGICRGLPSIRGYKNQSWMLREFIDRYDDTLKNRVLKEGLNMWYRLRTSLAVCFLCVLPAYLIIFYLTPKLVLSDIMVTIIMGTGLSTDMIELLFEWSRFEGCLIAVERCYNFHKVVPEAGYHDFKESLQQIDGSDASFQNLTAIRAKHQQSIVTEGRVMFRGVSCKYPTASRPALRDVSFEIQPGEKVGVVGRTGCGKTTLIKLIWRSLDTLAGEILIDGKNVRQVDLKSLRSQISIVTQDSPLIAGSLRENLFAADATQLSDQAMNAVLERIGFRHAEYLKANLEMQVLADGSNLSVGEKQLVNIARALLEDNKLILLDEATASIDLDTEQNVQRCLKEDFKNSTMLIVAHRMQTIMECHRLLVLEDGHLVRICTPAEFLAH